MSSISAWIVLKFGGSSVSSAENWNHIAGVIKERQKEGFAICVVHSALKEVSNKLQALVKVSQKAQAASIIDEIEEQHRALASQLGLNADRLLADYFRELENVSRGILLVGELSAPVQARLLALGELMATTLGAAYLNENDMPTRWQDARNLLESIPQKNATGEQALLSAVCDAQQDPALQETLGTGDGIILTQGFIARDGQGKTVLLGRGGSDVSAGYFAAKLAAKRLEIWTDVPGLFSANPHQIPSARLLKQLSYEEAQEIATNGAHVLHPRSIYPARRHGIPIHVRCTQRPALAGTVISDAGTDEGGVLKAVALRQNITLVSMESLNMWQQVGFLADAFAIFKQFGLSIDLISTSEANVTVSLDPSLNVHFEAVRDEFEAALRHYCKVTIIDSAAAISLLGRHIRTVLHKLGDAFEIFREHQMYLVSHAANDLNFTFVVNSEQAERLVRQLHQQVISKAGNCTSFGATWEALMQADINPEQTDGAWWRKEQKKLVGLARKNGSVYVYSANEIARNMERIHRLEEIDTCFFAMKANANAQILQQFYAAGFGFECVSIGEVERVIALFPEIDRGRILFTPNFAPRREYKSGFEYGVHVTLDNIYPLQQWPEIFEERELFLRIDPGHGQGHHKHVKTGGIHSKFGIPRFEIAEVKKLTESINANIKGLHAHVGSGIKDESVWKNTALILHEVAEELGGVEILDLGGGFGIKEQENEARLNLEAVNRSLKGFSDVYPDYRLWVEPGRFLVATAGVLLSRVSQLKGKGEVRYIGLETGMNSFIRPALYGASHTIINLSKLDQPASQTVNIVGPICESGDKLGIDRRFPESEEGDIICIANAGAYGYVMSSNYNLRAPAGEVVI